MSSNSTAPVVPTSTSDTNPTTIPRPPTVTSELNKVSHSDAKMAETDKNGIVPDEVPRAAGATDGGVVTEKPTVTVADSNTDGAETTLPSSANGNAVQTSQPQTVNEKVEPGFTQGAASTTEAKTADSTLKADAGVKDAHGRAGSKTSTTPSARKPTGANGQRKKPKKSLLSVIFSIIPCIHSSSAYPPELDLPPARDSASTEDAAKANEKALKTGTPPRGVAASKTTTVNDKEREKLTDTPDRIVTPTAKVEDATAVALPPSPSPITPSRSQQPTPDSALVVPTPTTSHLLPKDETAGLTSGAVQPPGSTGHEDEEPTTVHVPVHHDDEAESVHQADTTGHDADVDHELASDDDEERLIIQGGIGIPMVVCVFAIRRMTVELNALAGWTTEAAPSASVCCASRSQVPRSRSR